MRRAPIADTGAEREAPLVARQAGVVAGAMAAVIATALLITLGTGPLARPPGQVWATAALGPLACLLVSIGVLANRRFFSAQDIDAAAAGPPSRWARVNHAIIQNTLEQSVLALAVYAVLAIALPISQRGVIWAMSAAFVVGRIAFAAGYPFGAAGRAFGFGLTFYPTAAGLVWAGWRLLAD